MLKHFLISTLFATALSQLAIAGEATEPRYRVFPDIGLGFRTGGTFLEKPEARSFNGIFSLGAEVDTAFLSVDNAHYLIIPVSYMRPISRERQGSEEINVETLYQIVDTGLAYGFNAPFFSMGLTLGASIMVISTKMRLYALNNPEIDIGELFDPLDDAYVFPNREIVRTEKNVGIAVGPMVNLAFGFDIGRLLGVAEHFFEIRGAFQYVRRDVRNELYSWLAIHIHPMALSKRQIN